MVWEAGEAVQKVCERALARSHGVEVIGCEREDLGSSQHLANDDAMPMASMQAAPDSTLQLLEQTAPAEILLDTADHVQANVSIMNQG